MKIAMIGQKGIPCVYGGVERHVEKLATGLAKLGNQVSVYVRNYYTPKEMTGYRGVKLIHAPSIHTKNLDAISHTFFSTVQALFKRFDIIHYHGVGPALLAFLPRFLKPGTKVIVTFHCIDRKHAKWGRFAKLMLRLGELAANRFAHQTITVSKTLQQYCQEAYDNNPVYIPNGVDQPKEPANPQLIKKFGLEANKYLLAVGRLVGHKGFHYLLFAFKQLKNTDFKLAIVGDSVFTDDYVKKLKSLAENNPNIIFLGFQKGNELQALFENAYLFVHPSESEGLPLVLLEAAIYKKAILASDIPENMEIVKPDGFSFRNRQVNDLWEKLQHLLANPQLVTEAGQKLYRKVSQEYDFTKIIKTTERLYQDTIKQKLSLPDYSWQKV